MGCQEIEACTRNTQIHLPVLVATEISSPARTAIEAGITDHIGSLEEIDYA